MRPCLGLALLALFACTKDATSRDSNPPPVPGPAPLPVPPSPPASVTKTRRLEPWGNGSPAMLIDLPEDIMVDSTKGPDFDVHRAEHEGAELGIYVGHHPQRIQDPPGATRQAAKIAGRDIEWHTSPGRRETMVEGAFKAAKVGGGVDELVLHIFITGDGRPAEDLKKAAESLRLER